MGRPTKLTPPVERAIVSAIARGNTRKVAAEAVGINEATLYRWLQQGGGEHPVKLYREFREAITRAEAGAVMAAVGVVRFAGRTNWQAMTWWLERRYPDEWGRKDRVEVMDVVRREAKKLADEMGLDAEEVVADAERYLASRR